MAARVKKDLALVYARDEHRGGFRILRQRGGSRIEVGLLQPLQHGRAIVGEVVRLSPRDESPLLFEVETDRELSTPPMNQEASGRPPRVANAAYRDGWDAVWGRARRGPAS